MRELLERLDALLEATASTMDSEDFKDAIESNVYLDRTSGADIEIDNFNRFSKGHDTVFVTYYGVPRSASNTDKMNNRAMWEITGFSTELGSGPPSGKVKLKGMVMSPRLSDKRTRGKTATPEKMVPSVVTAIHAIDAKVAERARAMKAAANA